MKLQFINRFVALILFGIAVTACQTTPSQDSAPATQAGAPEQNADNGMEREFQRVFEELKAPNVVLVDEGRAIAGAAKAQITIVEWADFNCGHCANANETMKQLMKEYQGSVRVVFKHLPMLTKSSRTAAEYMEAIALQDKEKALRFHDAVFARQKDLRVGGEAFLKTLVKEVGADFAKAHKASKGDTVQKRIESDIAEAVKFEFNGTPAFMINGASVYGAFPYEYFKRIIDHVLQAKL